MGGKLWRCLWGIIGGRGGVCDVSSAFLPSSLREAVELEFRLFSERLE